VTPAAIYVLAVVVAHALYITALAAWHLYHTERQHR
jgi:hypothetical protein